MLYNVFTGEHKQGERGRGGHCSKGGDLTVAEKTQLGLSAGRQVAQHCPQSQLDEAGSHIEYTGRTSRAVQVSWQSATAQ